MIDKNQFDFGHCCLVGAHPRYEKDTAHQYMLIAKVKAQSNHEGELPRGGVFRLPPAGAAKCHFGKVGFHMQVGHQSG